MNSAKKCLLLINTSSGNSKKAADNQKLYDRLKSMYEVVDRLLINGETERIDVVAECVGYDTLCVSGGDGTLNSVINAVREIKIDLLYFPIGTVNDFAKKLKTKKLSDKKISVDLGEFNDLLFSYVAATGTFTPIGYTSKTKRKKIFKKLAYWFSALKQFRSQKIKAKIDVDGKIFEDTYTLIMAVKSNRVFGFNFNRLYKHNDGRGHLLLIKTPTGIFKFMKLFCRFFRAFFIGFTREKNSEKIKFLEFSNVHIDFEQEQIFCVDGEKDVSLKQNTIQIYKEQLNLTLLNLK